MNNNNKIMKYNNKMIKKYRINNKIIKIKSKIKII